MPHRIEVSLKPSLPDPAGRRMSARIASDLGFVVDDLRVADEFIIDRNLSARDLEMVVEEVFQDPVIQEAAVDQPLKIPFDWLIEVGFRPGVTDNVGRTAREAVERALGVQFQSGEGLYTRKLYFIKGEMTREQADTIAKDLLANDLIQTRAVFAPGDDRSAITVPRVTSRSEAVIRTINLNVDDEALLRISKEGVLALSLDEMRAIRDYYQAPVFVEQRDKAGLGPEVTDCELEVLAQTWSEHCKHKIFNALIQYQEGGKSREIDSLFKSCVQASTEKIRSELGKNDFCLSVFKDNAGVIRFDDEWNLVVKVETHNSPSALDPYGGRAHRHSRCEPRSIRYLEWVPV